MGRLSNRLVGGLTVATLLALFTALMAWPRSPGPDDSGSNRDAAAVPTPAPLPAPILPLVERLAPAPEPMNLLVLGVDEGETRTDIVLLAHWDPSSNQASLISLPRDTLVPIPCPNGVTACRSPDKLGHAHAYGSVVGEGPAVIKATVEGFLGVTVDHYIRIDFDGFRRVVDGLGGITLEVEADMAEIGLTAGAQRLNGEQALAYVRYRGDPTGDFGRMRRTQSFLKALMEQAIEEVPRQELPQLALRLAAHVQTDIDAGVILSLLRFWAEAGEIPSVRGASLPGRAHWERNLWFWVADEEATAELVQEYITSPALAAE